MSEPGETAARLSAVLRVYARAIDELIGYCQHPGGPQNEDWWQEIRRPINDAFNDARNLVRKLNPRDKSPDLKRLESVLGNARRWSTELAALLHFNERISTVRYDLWPSRSDREQVERLIDARLEIERAAEGNIATPDAPGARKEPAADSATVIVAAVQNAINDAVGKLPWSSKADGGSAKPVRLAFDDEKRTVTLDGAKIMTNIHCDAYRIIKAVAEADGAIIRFAEIQRKAGDPKLRKDSKSRYKELVLNALPMKHKTLIEVVERKGWKLNLPPEKT